MHVIDETNTSLGDLPGSDFLHLYVEGWRSRKARRRPIHQSVAALPATTRASCSGRSLSPVGQFSDCLAKTAELRAELEDVLPGLSDMLTSTEAVNDTLPEENRGQNTRSLLK